jgi:hypothetical protein
MPRGKSLIDNAAGKVSALVVIWLYIDYIARERSLSLDCFQYSRSIYATF